MSGVPVHGWAKLQSNGTYLCHCGLHFDTRENLDKHEAYVKESTLATPAYQEDRSTEVVTELDVLSQCVTALNRLTDDQLMRVMPYLWDRYSVRD